MTSRAPVVVGISGASGAPIALRVLERLDDLQIPVHLIVTPGAQRTIAQEIGPEALDLIRSLAHRIHPPEDVGASVASGSFATAGMIVVPCSMHSLAAIATGLTHNLLVRAADVHLKERRRLVLLPREAPLHLGHLRNLCRAAELGAVILPPVPAFYHRPQSLAEVIDGIAARAIDLLGLAIAPLTRPWNPDEAPS